jgi:excisionase family DNA binding protein
MSTIAAGPPPVADIPALLDVRGVAALLDCSPRHIYRLADAGRMPTPVRLGALVRWSRQAIESWIEKGCPTLREWEARRAAQPSGRPR